MVFPRLNFRLSLLALLLLVQAPTVSAALSIQKPLELGVAAHYETAPYTFFLEDTDHRLGIADISKPSQLGRFQSLSSIGGEANWGYSSSTFWLALPVSAGPNAVSDWLMEVGFSSLDRVELYVPRQSGGFDMQTAGDFQPFAERPFPHRNLVFPVHIPPNISETIFLKVVSQGSMTVPVKLWQHDALHHQDQINYAVLCLYFGSLLALGLYNLLLYLSTREKVFLAYVAFVLAMAVSQASLCGLGNQFIWPTWPAWGDTAFASGTAATGLFGALFSRIFLNTKAQFPRIDRALLLMAAVFAVATISPAFISYRFAAMLTTVSGFVFSALATWSGFYCMRRRHPGARLFLIAWLLLLAGVAMLALRNFGLIPTNNITLHGMQIGSSLEMLLLSFALADRINVMRREKEHAQEEALAVKQEMVDTLRRSEYALEQKVLERTRSVEDVNRQLREKEVKLQQMALHDPLTGLANRLLLDETLERAINRSQRDNSNLALLVIDLDGFKEVNDSLGHIAGDILLQTIAERIKTTIRAMDTASRLGGDEFVVLLENLHETEAAFRVADQIIEQIALPVDLPMGNSRISASMGIAFFPQHAQDALQLLKSADKAMYSAKAAGRNCWRIADSGTTQTSTSV
jgi:diguanylate cyclase (GGDEF)-like protein